MTNQNTRKILFTILVVVIVSSCGLHQFIPKGVDLDDDVLRDLTTNSAGLYETIGELANFSDIEKIENQCAPGIPGKSGRQERLDFEDNKLIISDETGERTYVYQEFAKFCRELDNGNIECIYNLTNASYHLSVYESENLLRECFSGQMSLNRIDQPQVVESQLEDTIDSDNDDADVMQGDADSSQESEAGENDPQVVESQLEDTIDSDNDDADVMQGDADSSQESEAGENDPQDANQAVLFSLDDCSCGGVNVPLNVDSSSASNNLYKMGIVSGGPVEVVGHLTCDWQDIHQSEHKTGTIRIYLNVYKFDHLQYAQTLFTEFRKDIKLRPPYCKKDSKSCTVAIKDFGEDRAFYVWKNIYVRGKRKLPSDHGAVMARLITVAESYYVLELSVTHPELAMGDNWVIDTSQAVEACVVSIANR